MNVVVCCVRWPNLSLLIGDNCFLCMVASADGKGERRVLKADIGISHLNCISCIITHTGANLQSDLMWEIMRYVTMAVWEGDLNGNVL